VFLSETTTIYVKKLEHKTVKLPKAGYSLV